MGTSWHTSAIDYTRAHCDHDEALTASVMIWLIVSSSLWVIGCYRYDCSSVQMLIECTKLLTGAPQARRFAAMCTSGFGHRAQYSSSKALLVTLRVSDEAGIGTSTKGGLRHQCFLENHGTENPISHAGSGSGCERSVSYLLITSPYVQISSRQSTGTIAICMPGHG